MGRLFLPEDELEGTDRVAIVTDGYWRGRLGGEGELLGRAITLNGVEHAINRGQDRTVLGKKCKLSFQFSVTLARSPGARLEPLGHLSRMLQQAET